MKPSGRATRGGSGPHRLLLGLPAVATRDEMPVPFPEGDHDLPMPSDGLAARGTCAGCSNDSQGQAHVARKIRCNRVQAPLQAATKGGNPGCVCVCTAYCRRIYKGANLGQKTLMRRNLIVVKRVRVVIAVDCHVILVEGAELCFRVARMHLSR